MTVLKGHVSGGAIVAEDALPDSFEGKEVIITILDKSFEEKNRTGNIQKNDNVARQLDALDKLSGLFSKDEMKNVDKSIADGIKIKEIAL